MKNSLLIALLGFTVSVVAPSIATADDFKFGPSKNYKNEQKRNHSHNNRHANKQFAKQNNQNQRVTKAKPPKLPHQKIIAKLDQKIHNKQQRRHNQQVKRNHSNQHHYNKHNPSFSVTWNSKTPNIIYSNGYYNNYYGKRAPRYANSIYERQQRQQRKIRNGIDKGQLVKREVKKLRQEQRQIKHKLAHYKRDGRLNRHERARLHQMLDIAANNIRNKKHNRLTRWSKPRNYNYEYAWY